MSRGSAMQWGGAILRCLMVAGLVACGPGTGGSLEASSTGATTEESTAMTSSSSLTATGPGSASATTTSSDSAGTSATTVGSGSLDDTSSTGAECDPHAPLECEGWIWGCGNGLDDDGDGLIDLEDPNCISPCDDSEDQFPQSIPGDNIGCYADCSFDGNTGMGDDGCRWRPSCDPLAEPSPTCTARPEQCEGLPEVPPQCVQACEARVPNGCDCFGCCTIYTDAGPVDVRINQPLDSICSLERLEGCPPCTKFDDLCGNPCETDQCEICMGSAGAPAPCEQIECVGGTACEDRCDCGPDEYCLTGCCLPMPVG